MLFRASIFMTGLWRIRIVQSEMGEFNKELMEMIVEICNIPQPLLENFSENSPLTGPNSLLGLDSLDGVEIIVSVQKKYNVRIDNQQSGREILSTLKSLSEFIKHSLNQARLTV